MKSKTKSTVIEFCSFVLVFTFSFFCAFLVNQSTIPSLLTQLPNILGILLAGVLASLAILFGLLTPTELSNIKRENTPSKDHGEDRFLNFLSSVKSDTKMIFFGFFISYLISLIYTFDSSRLNFQISVPQNVVFLNWDYFLLATSLSVFFISISCTYDIIMCVFILNKQKYESSFDSTKEKKE